MRTARLNNDGHLVGVAEVDEVVPKDCICVDPGDLPLDGTYKWMADREQFVPLGFGLPRVGQPPITTERAVFLLARSLGKDVPPELKNWCRWYEDHLKQRDEEAKVRGRRRRAR